LHGLFSWFLPLHQSQNVSQWGLVNHKWLSNNTFLVVAITSGLSRV
jgi:hypothetical protein